MTHEQFWQIIATACQSDPRSAEDWDQRLIDALSQLPADEIIKWDQIFDEFAVRAYRADLWAAAYIINGGASDDGFYYFRCWLIGMGEKVYQNAVADPDSLADVASPNWHREGIDAEAEIYAAAMTAWERLTGKDYSESFPARNDRATLVGETWDFDDSEATKKILPRLCELYGDY